MDTIAVVTPSGHLNFHRIRGQWIAYSGTGWADWAALVRQGVCTTHNYGPATYGHTDIILNIDLRPTHGCGLCDGPIAPIRYDATTGSTEYGCTRCDYWHISTDCCEQVPA